MLYTHISQGERYQIAALLKAGQSANGIARLLGRSKSTVFRELQRNHGDRGYRPKQAQEKAQERATASRNAQRISAQTWAAVDEGLAKKWSPQQIQGRLRLDGEPSVSHESIYKRIYANKRSGGSLHLALRSQKPRRKRYGGRDRRGALVDQVSIDERPAIVGERGRFGDWEADLVIGAGHKEALVTINERTTRFTLIGRVPNKTAAAVAQQVISLMTPFASSVHTITTDNGKEFAHHKEIAKALNAQYYFAHPYSSWERGANENMNGLIRQYFPKKMRFDQIEEGEPERTAHEMNRRPRRCLGYRTPYEAFMTQLQSASPLVALHG